VGVDIEEHLRGTVAQSVLGVFFLLHFAFGLAVAIFADGFAGRDVATDGDGRLFYFWRLPPGYNIFRIHRSTRDNFVLIFGF